MLQINQLNIQIVGEFVYLIQSRQDIICHLLGEERLMSHSLVSLVLENMYSMYVGQDQGYMHVIEFVALLCVLSFHVRISSPSSFT